MRNPIAAPGTAQKTSFRQSATTQNDPARALEELDRELRFNDSAAAILFVSSEYDLAKLQKEITRRIGAPTLCCTTGGELSSQLGYTTGGIAAATITDARARLVPLPALSKGTEQYNAALAQAAEEFSETTDDAGSIGLFTIDGLCRCEESVIEHLQLALPTVPIVGGSAGDACQFKQTQVYINGRFESDAGALLLLSGGFNAVTFQTHHFVSTGIRVVATEVDVANRRLIRLDGMPAAARMAQLLGCGMEDITADRLTTKPMMLRCGDHFFVRGVHTVHPDASLSFFCALREGDILHIGRGADIVDITASYFEALRRTDSTPDLVLGFDCIQRRIELAMRGKTAEMNTLFKQVPLTGFSTFGEQYNGQHVNQTMTGVAFWKR